LTDTDRIPLFPRTRPPHRVECDGCGAVEPIERMAVVNLSDGTPEMVAGGGTVAVQHYCLA
jgi:hypothetical protein